MRTDEGTILRRNRSAIRRDHVLDFDSDVDPDLLEQELNKDLAMDLASETPVRDIVKESGTKDTVTPVTQPEQILRRSTRQRKTPQRSIEAI